MQPQENESAAEQLTALLTQKKAAEYLGISEATMATWRCTRRVSIPYVKIGRAVRYRRVDLDRFAESQVVVG